MFKVEDQIDIMGERIEKLQVNCWLLT